MWRKNIRTGRRASDSVGSAFRYGLREDEFKKTKNTFTFRRVNLIYFIYKNKGLNIGRLSSYLTENMANFH